jgi:hypothetical protein
MRRVKQPSTYAGIAGILQGVKAFLPQYSAYLDAATIAAGTVAALVHEQGAKAPKAPK